MTFLFTIPFSALASSYPSVGKIPEGPGGSNYAYNSFEEFKRSVNDGNKAAEEVDQNFSLSSDMMGVSGPFSFNFTWSDDYGLIFNTKFASMMSKRTAYALEGELGFKMNRVNLTIGHALSPRNRIKLTVERLAQKQSFDFDSGSVDEWVSQYAGGGEFQHILGAGFLNNISFGGYYAQALSKILDPLLYFDSDNIAWINYRHIAGATSKGFNTALGFRPWKTATLTLTGYYDWLHYRNLYETVSADDSSDIGYGVSLSQYISNSLQVTASYVNRAVYTSIEMGLSFCHNIFHDTRALAISIGGARSGSDNVERENSITLGFNYYFVPMDNTYHLPGFQMPSLKAWTSKPAVRMDQVLAAADQKSERAEVISPLSDVFTYAEVATTGTIAEQIVWNDITTNVPNGELEYYLTLINTTSASNGLLKTDQSSLPDNKLVNGDTYTVDGLTPGAVYSVKLRAVEKNSGASHTYTDSFTAGADGISWPDDLGLDVISMSNDDGLLKAKITFNLATSSISSPMSYYVTVTSDIDASFDFKTTVNDEAVKNGFDVSGLHPNIDDYTVTVTPTDAYGTTIDAKTSIFKTSKGEITWSNKEQEVDVTPSATTATVGFAKATPSIEDTIVTYSISGVNQKDSTDTFSKTITSSDCTGTTCSAGITGLSPVSTYSIKVTVSDDWDNSISSAEGQTFTTAQGDMSWSDAGQELPYDAEKNAVKLYWSKATSSIGSSLPITYTIYNDTSNTPVKIGSVKSTDAACTGNDKCQFTISALSTGSSYKVHVEAEDDIDGMKSTAVQTVSTLNGTIKWSATGVDFDKVSKLSWDKATSDNGNNVTYQIVITSSPDSPDKNVVVQKTSSDNNGAANYYTITGTLTKKQTYYVWITASAKGDDDITKGGAKFDFLIPGGTLTFDKITNLTLDGDHQTISWDKASNSTSGDVDVTYDLTVTPAVGTQGTLTGSVTANIKDANPSSTVKDKTGETAYFLPGVKYTISIKAHDQYDSNEPNPETTLTPSYSVTWTWDSSATISSKPNQWKTAKQYSITIDKPDVSVDPSLGTIKNSYAIYKSSNTNTSISSGDTLVKSETLYTAQVKPSVSDLPMDKYYKVKLTAYVDGYENSKNDKLIETKVIAK